MASGRVAISIILEEAEKTALTALTRKHGAPQSLAMRARIVLAAANGLSNKEIAAKLDVSAHTVGVWRKRFASERMEGLYDESRPGAPRQIGDEEIAATIRTPGVRRIGACGPWPSRWPRAVHDSSHLAGFRLAAASHRDLQTLVRSTVRREGA
jgi:DNA-binding CsgD family transcriptional regulator